MIVYRTRATGKFLMSRVERMESLDSEIAGNANSECQFLYHLNFSCHFIDSQL